MLALLIGVLNFMGDIISGDYDDGVKQLDMPRKRKKDDKVGFEKPKMETTKEYLEGVEDFYAGKDSNSCPYESEAGHSEKRTRYYQGYYYARVAPLLGETVERPIVECQGA